MPWHVSKDSRCPTSKPWACIKDDDRSIEGCHPTKAKAEAQMRALYASEEARVDAITAQDWGDKWDDLPEAPPLVPKKEEP